MEKIIIKYLKIKSKIETLKINVSAGADQDTLREIEKLDKGFEVEYRLFIYKIKKPRLKIINKLNN